MSDSRPATTSDVTVIGGPTLIFHGARDKAVPERFAQRTGALIAQSTVLVVDSGHFIPVNSPEIVAAELRCFFERTDRDAKEISGPSVSAPPASAA
jgi:pimeloyl-ACP methyl ester carboxylesterase